MTGEPAPAYRVVALHDVEAVSVPDPRVRRHGVATERGTEVLAFGGDPVYPARPARRAAAGARRRVRAAGSTCALGPFAPRSTRSPGLDA